jgi:hypothetical protein
MEVEFVMVNLVMAIEKVNIKLNHHHHRTQGL